MNRGRPARVGDAVTTVGARSLGGAHHEHQALHRLFFVILASLYAGYVLMFWLSTGWDEFFAFPDWRVFQRLFLLAAPIYTLVLWQHREELLPIDRHMTYVPLLIWLAATYARVDPSKGLMNFVVVEPQIVGLLYGLQLARFFVGARLHHRGHCIAACVTAASLAILAALVAFMVPGVPD